MSTEILFCPSRRDGVNCERRSRGVFAEGRDGSGNEKTPPHSEVWRGLYKAGNDLLSRWKHYHRPQVLNGRVRNGNGCFHLGMFTGKLLGNNLGWTSEQLGRNKVVGHVSTRMTG